MEIQSIKLRFGIIGNAAPLNRALETALRVASTDLSVLVTGESGTGKEIIPKIIHQLSARKFGKYIAVNCGAIPEGTIDSELFGHEKGSFTGAQGVRKGYFEEANNGTIFLDEVAELPLQTQVRLLRVLETGEFMKVGSSQVQKTDVRIVAATNVNIPEAINRGKFREDLYYRLNTVPVQLPSLKERGEDIELLFRKFASDFAEKYRMPSIRLNDEAKQMLLNYKWPGNIRQLKNITEQISVIEKNREIDAAVLLNYLPEMHTQTLPALYRNEDKQGLNEREILYKVLFDMRNDITDLKKLVYDLIQHGSANFDSNDEKTEFINRLYKEVEENSLLPVKKDNSDYAFHNHDLNSNEAKLEDFDHSEEIIEESLSLEDKEREMIKKALDKYHGKRKYASQELGISERTLYRKIKEYGLTK